MLIGLGLGVLLVFGAPWAVSIHAARYRVALQTFAQHGRDWKAGGNAGVCPCRGCHDFRRRVAPHLTAGRRAR